MDRLELFNKVALAVKADSVTGYTPISDLNITWDKTGLDSLDAIMVNVYLAEVFGIDEEVSKQFMFTTPNELLDLVEHHKTITPASIEEILEVIQ